MIDPETLDWDKADGLIPAIVQDAATGEVRMLGYMDRAALDATLRDGFVTFHSRSRGRLWRKGESSGNVLEVVEVRPDCDRDALLILARPHGPTCHTGAPSCFGVYGAPGTGFLGDLARLIGERSGADPAGSYTARLLAGRAGGRGRGRAGGDRRSGRPGLPPERAAAGGRQFMGGSDG
jgi:phosphoribosyl-ATP pyrophosphohydrolase/phosphoribosyl-AMP cyclohydrolase